ncbi:hypothetical protein C6A85_12410, partial [Mycobacterium sp. ITM-2017-0098]
GHQDLAAVALDFTFERGAVGGQCAGAHSVVSVPLAAFGVELFNGFWVLGVSSKEEAKQWALKCPLGPDARLEVRRITESEE